MGTEADISDTLIAKSLQLNADDIIAGPIVVTVTGVKRNSDDKQPVAVEIEGRMPFIPCKTMRRVIVKAWGADARKWVGRSMRLYRDPDVVYAGEKVGGIRISAMSHIDGKFEIALSERRGSKKKFVVEKLDTAKQKAAPKQAAPPQQQQPSLDVAGMFKAWKAAREANHQPVDETSLRAFVEAATGGAITAENAKRSASYTPQLLAVCLSEIAKLSPDGESDPDEVPFGE